MYLLMFFISLSVLFYFSRGIEKSNKYAYKTMRINSPVFENGEIIPVKYTCDGQDISPPLEWYDFPEDTKSFVLICRDPDAPRKVWVHWVIYNLSRHITHLKENIPKIEELPNGAVQGKNDFGKIGYGGPCPPGGLHHYEFKIFALNIHLNLEAGLNSFEILSMIDGHILAEGKLVGKYKRH